MDEQGLAIFFVFQFTIIVEAQLLGVQVLLFTIDWYSGCFSYELDADY